MGPGDVMAGTLWGLVKKMSIHISMGCTAFLDSLLAKEPNPGGGMIEVLISDLK